MKKAIKLTLAVVLVMGATSLFAQKFGRINTQEIIMAMPETKTMQENMDTFAKELSDNIETMNVEFNTKLQDFQKNYNTFSDAIKEVKEKFGPISNTGTNDNFSTTKTLKFGTRTSEEAKFDGFMEWPEASKYYIKGKVISSDRQGNIYKSLYIYDGTAGIELKLYNGLYLDFLLDLASKPIKSQWVYVRLDGLYLGNYRMMLSIGGAPSDGINTAGNHKFYANSNLDNPKVAALNVFRGEYTTLDDSDIKEVDGSNYTSLGEADLGRLVRFNKIKIRYAGVKNQDGVTPPNLKNGGNANPYPSWIVTDWGTPIFGAWYRWAYNNSEQNIRLYGSVLMSYNDAAEYTSDPGVYGIRTSGYSQFAMKPIPKDGTEGTVLGIYGIYAKKSDFTGGSEDWAQYQISVSRIEDLGFPPESLLSEEWIRANTPASSLTPPVKNGGDDYEGD
mgnify:CR=1 FL=1